MEISSGPDQVPKTVVIINDDQTQLQFFTSILTKNGFRVFGYSDPVKALKEIAGRPVPDLIVTDLHMPKLDGWKLCRLLRSQEFHVFNRVPLMLVSATFSGLDARNITMALGADAFLAAPYDAAQFMGQVQDLLAGRGLTPSTSVLIIEDSKTLALILQKAFQADRYEVTFALDGQEGRRLFHQHRPELVILDYHLPDVLGDRLLEEFKQAYPHCVVIMMTVNPSPELATHFMSKGAAAYLRKPFDPKYLLTLCEYAQRERALLRVEDVLDSRTKELRVNQTRLRKALAERERAEKELVTALHEKEILLKEVHHRVKNNLQVIMSLLNMQAKLIPDERAKAAFKDSRDRIKSMALIHETLHQAGNLAAIDLKGYTRGLVRHLLHALKGQAGRIDVKFDLEDIKLTIDQAVPCGLVLNELLTNAIKYAFPNDQNGEIEIKARRLPPEEIEITVRDNGVGLPDNLDLTMPDSLGLQLVSLLVENQLNGVWEAGNDPGAKFVLRWSLTADTPLAPDES